MEIEIQKDLGEEILIRLKELEEKIIKILKEKNEIKRPDSCLCNNRA